MISTPRWHLFVLASLGSLVTAGASAQDGGNYFYGGLSLGQSRAKIDEARITSGLLGGGLTSTAFSRDESDTAYRVFGGYQMNRYFGLELGYFSLGKFGFTSTTTPTGSLTGQINVRGLNLDLVATLPLTERFALIGRLGATEARSTDQFTGTGAVAVLNPNPSQRAGNVKIGGGLQYEFSRSFIVRGEAERYRIDDAVGNRGGVNVLSVSLVFPFGRAEQAAPRPMASAPYVPPAPAPTPEPMPVPAPVIVAATPVAPPPAVVVAERRRVGFSAESLFGFDQSTLKPGGRAALDRFADEVRGTRFDVITVEGHTDRLGSKAYNQRLSLQRAEAVKDYLASAGGFDAGKIDVVGKGESQPVTLAGDCKGSAPSAKLIGCLQPDRRVEIEVTGTR